MIRPVLPLSELAQAPATVAGIKARTLALLAQQGMTVPPTLCIPATVYRHYLWSTGLQERLALELGRKNMMEMRWEELWDLGLRIRHLFLHTPLPVDLERELRLALPEWVGHEALVLRSAATDGDQPGHSFAGLHESVLNVRGVQALLEALRQVWASLWSDRALLYRRELHLDPRRSAMAVLLQPLMEGRSSGLVICRHPAREQRMVIEACWGLNGGLLEGVADPDRWLLEHDSGEVLQHQRSTQRCWTVPGDGGTEVRPVPPGMNAPPLASGDLRQLHTIALGLEALLGEPQEVEWTFVGERPVLLQTRPAGPPDTDRERRWHLGLHRSLPQLLRLQREIETELLPRLRREVAADALPAPEALDDAALAARLDACRRQLRLWEDIYRDRLVPMAHAVRLFGQTYNDLLHPADSFAFVELLQGTPLEACRRNHRLQLMAERLRRGDEAGAVRALARFLTRYAVLGYSRELVWQLARRLATEPTRLASPPLPAADVDERLASLPAASQARLRRLLALGRCAWRLRDDDNLWLQRLRLPFRRAAGEIRRRLAQGDHPLLAALDLTLPRLALPRSSAAAAPVAAAPAGMQLWPRQLVGQPAGPGWAQGPARRVRTVADLAQIRPGDVLVCDALNASLTLVAPLLAGIVEERGGMLIHGAIIAREYGLPCVTGVPRASERIHDGDRLTVDGFLGLVTLETGPLFSGNEAEA